MFPQLSAVRWQTHIRSPQRWTHTRSLQPRGRGRGLWYAPIPPPGQLSSGFYCRHYGGAWQTNSQPFPDYSAAMRVAPGRLRSPCSRHLRRPGAAAVGMCQAAVHETPTADERHCRPSPKTVSTKVCQQGNTHLWMNVPNVDSCLLDRLKAVQGGPTSPICGSLRLGRSDSPQAPSRAVLSHWPRRDD